MPYEQNARMREPRVSIRPRVSFLKLLGKIWYNFFFIGETAPKFRGRIGLEFNVQRSNTSIQLKSIF
jgi:hypothetical protein